MKVLYIFVVLLVVIFIFSESAVADIYMYRDKDGVMHFTHTPDSPEYRLYIRSRSANPSDSLHNYEIQRIKKVQSLLNELGYGAGPVDGVIGEKTKRAIIKYQIDCGVKPTGLVTHDLIAMLQNSMDQSKYARKSPERPINKRIHKNPQKISSILPQYVENAKSEVLTPEKLFQEVNDSIYTVIVQNGSNDMSLGTAVAVTNNKLLTNYHIIERGWEITLIQDKIKIEASCVASNEDFDLAVLQVSGLKLKPIPNFRSYNQLSIGETVYAIGNPSGLDRTLTNGIISGFRNIHGVNVIQNSASISNGSSGGALIDSKGNLIGITTFNIRDSQNLNFAIAVEEFWNH